MGNQLIKNYDIQKDSNGVAGFCSLWKIYPGVRQEKTLQGPNTVSIFMLDKKFLDKANKNIREDSYSFLRKEAQSLAKFKQPNCLSMIEPLVEDAKNMAFVTEYVQSSLQNYINNNNVSEIYSTDFEVKMHLLELLQALSFFHNDVKMAHLGISPENIYVTLNGKWKLGGMVFTTQLLNDKKGDSSNVDFNARNDGLLVMGPNPNFSAPEVYDMPSKCCFSSDIFSLGLLIYSLFKTKAEGNTTSIYCINANNLTQYKDKISSVSQNLQREKFFKEMPQTLKSLLLKMLQIEPSLRPTVSDILGSAWFNDPFIQTIAHLETLAQKDVSQQQLFLKGLSKILLKFEAKVIKTIILPSLMDFLKLEQLSPIIIQIIIIILEQNTILNKGEFNDIIWPSIKSLTTGKEIPAQSLYLLVSNIKVLCEFISNNDLQAFLMPLILKCYECGVSKLQELALQNTEFLVKKLDFVFIKTKILPRVLKLCVENNADLRRNSLFCLNKIYHLFERSTIIEQVIGTLEKIKKMGADPKMNIIILNIYEGISKTIGIEVIATKILPNLVCNLSDLNLSKSEFKSYLTTIQSLLKKIEEERLASDSGPTKEDESDMNKILKEIEDMDKDQTKKNNEIFAAMQGPTNSNDFDFLSLFDGGGAVNLPQKNESVSSNDINIPSQNQPQQQPTKEVSSGPQITNKFISQENQVQKPTMGQKMDENFDFFNEIENSNKAFQTAPKPKAQNQGLFNQAVQMKKNQTVSSNGLTNMTNNESINQNNNSQNLFNNLNINQKTTSPNLNLNQPNQIQQKSAGFNSNINFNSNNSINNNKGNMTNLNYDPFSELENKSNNNNNNSNPFSLDSMNTGLTNINKVSSTKPIQSQNIEKNDIGGGWNFDDFQAPNNPQSSMNLNLGSVKVQKTSQPQNNFAFTPPVIQNQNTKNNQGGINIGAGVQPTTQNKKLSDNFDFFQNAKPVEQGLKINKFNPTFKNDDLI